MGALQGKVALVTGAGRGLGAEICRLLGAEGMSIFCADIQERLAEEVAEELRGAGAEARAMRLDVSREAEARRAVEAVGEAAGRLDVLVNNAAIDVTAPCEALSAEEWERIVAVNLNGPFFLTRAAFPGMKRQGGGSVVNIASTASKRAWANASAYHATKWGLLGLSHALHVEGRPHGIKVTAVVSGGMRTPFLLDRFPDIDLGNLQDPKNVAETVRFVLTLPAESVIPEVMVLPLRETSWP